MAIRVLHLRLPFHFLSLCSRLLDSSLEESGTKHANIVKPMVTSSHLDARTTPDLL